MEGLGVTGSTLLLGIAWATHNRYIVAHVVVLCRSLEPTSLTQHVKLRNLRMTPNPSIERTRSGRLLQAIISFLAFHSPPPRAAHVKR